MVTVKSRTDGSTYARDVTHIKKLKLPVEIQENGAEHHKNEPNLSETETRNEKITEKKNLHHAIVPRKVYCIQREPTKRFEPRRWCSVYYLFIISSVLTHMSLSLSLSLLPFFILYTGVVSFGLVVIFCVGILYLYFYLDLSFYNYYYCVIGLGSFFTFKSAQ